MTTKEYVWGKLVRASQQPGRGQLAKIARAADCDVRTVRAILSSATEPHATTLDKLAAYFRKEDRRSKAQ